MLFVHASGRKNRNIRMAQDAEVGMKCISYMLFTTNFMFAMIGFLLISVGSTITAIFTDFETFILTQFSPAALLIAIGVIIFIVSLFGCFGAIKKSTCLINTYAFLLSLILILEISAAIAAYSMRSNVAEYVGDNMQTTIAFYKKHNSTKAEWDYLQSRLQCCGINGPEDWKEILNIEPPSSCYRGDIKMELNNLYTGGCLNRLHFIMHDCATLIGTGAICVAVVQLLGVIFGFMLAKSVRRLKTEQALERDNRQRFYAQMARGTSDKPTPVLYTPTESNA
ncbi:PREDICTED: leukocyte surface antigen CD53-like [Nicrophorus vespilloides]|uniref:Tetraspanin n=1 Tax=Nicrophorus vespilloides TaxID=110193 RepID=A0ABM1MLS5_NICVS|nr:PREDICTED: leukocyte surface antigen CD53-like [Nicrophorus vespilloides]